MAHWARQLEDVLKKMPVGEVILTGCGCAIKIEGYDENEIELPVEEGEWLCTCGRVKSPLEIADLHGPYELYGYGKMKIHDWYKEEV